MSDEHKPQTAGKQSAPKAKTKPAKTGRPVEDVPADKAEEICAWLASGKTMRAYCREEGSPAWRTVYDWIAKDQEFAARVARAREEGHDAIAEETLEIIDSEPEYITSEGGSRVDSGHVAWRKNQVWLRLQLLAKWNPRKYGDRVGVDHQGGISINVVTGVPEE